MTFCYLVLVGYNHAEKLLMFEFSPFIFLMPALDLHGTDEILSPKSATTKHTRELALFIYDTRNTYRTFYDSIIMQPS